MKGLRRRFRYRVDDVLGRGIGAPLLVLGGITLVVVLVASAILTALNLDFAGDEDENWLEGFWQSGLRLMDPGTMADDVGWWARAVALLVTMVGILIVGTLIGVIASGVEQRVDALRRGRSEVVESGHVLILGESGRLPMIIRQLALSGASRKGNAIVVLADDETGELSDEVRASVGDLHGSRLVFRRGNPARASDLARVGIRQARSVIVLADEDSHGDAAAVVAVLAAGAGLGGFGRVPIVAELNDPETVETLVDACDGEVLPVAGMQVVARFTAFALREPGLNQVVGELFDFRGADIYLREAGELAGRPFGEIVFRFAQARPIGRVTAVGEVELNPDPAATLGADEQLILIAEDATGLDSGPPTAHALPTSDAVARTSAGPEIEHLLVVGWNMMGAQLLAELDRRVAPGSTVEIVYDSRLFGEEELNLPTTSQFEVRLLSTASLTWRLREATHAADLTSVVLLGYRRGLSVLEADSRTLLNLMLLNRDLGSVAGPSARVIVELLDADNANLPRGMTADDYVVSDALVSRVMSQVAEQPQRRQVLFSLYAGDGPSLHLVRAGELALDGEHDFEEIVATTYMSRRLAIGWRMASHRGGTLVLNPSPSERVSLHVDDDIVVIA
ncbi:MAG: hypothetical protein QNM02_11530 [Acidimicrobiia bacterium]|nr:hypothetical protein [Acidimicrobiia bacterium]